MAGESVGRLAPEAASPGRRLREGGYQVLFFVCALLSIFVSIGIVVVLVGEALAFFEMVPAGQFFFGTEWSPRASRDPRFSIWPLLTGTLMIALGASLVALPIGLATAVYLSEYASDRVRAFVKPVLEILAGIPTVVYGYFALTFVTPYVLQPLFGLFGLELNVFNALSASLTVGIMIIPVVSSLSEDALRSVPRDLREAAYALGASKYDTVVRVVLPAATSGIIASFLLAVSRAVGETMIVAMAAGADPKIAFNPLESVQTMTAYIVQQSLGDTPAGTLVYQSLFAVALSLFAMTLAMNVLAQWVVRRYREVYE